MGVGYRVVEKFTEGGGQSGAGPQEVACLME